MNRARARRRLQRWHRYDMRVSRLAVYYPFSLARYRAYWHAATGRGFDADSRRHLEKARIRSRSGFRNAWRRLRDAARY